MVWPSLCPSQTLGDQPPPGILAHQTPKLPGPKLPGENTPLQTAGPHRVAGELEPHPGLIGVSTILTTIKSKFQFLQIPKVNTNTSAQVWCPGHCLEPHYFFASQRSFLLGNSAMGLELNQDPSTIIMLHALDPSLPSASVSSLIEWEFRPDDFHHNST